MADPRRRFEELADRVGEKARPAGRRAESAAFEEGYWQELRDLFTRDLSSRELQRLLTHEARESLRYFVRELDFEALASLPWYKRHPRIAWRTFTAIAYRLSPARRLLFALGTLLLAWGWAVYVFTPVAGSFGLLVIAGTLLFVVLALELRDKLVLKSDLEIARQIQFGLLPFEPFDRGSIAIRTAMRPANTVGGDYFDVVELEAGRLAFMVGDVSGKGMPAALLMALLQGSLRTLLTAGLRGEEMVAKLNAHLSGHMPSNRLVTLFYAELEQDSGVLRYVNAGHNPPLIERRSGAIERLASTGMALGILADAVYTGFETAFEAGDRILLYTDGITEANNVRDEEFGEQRLEEFLEQQRGIGDQALIDRLLAAVLRFCGPVAPRDDMTLMVVSRRPEA